MIPGGAALARAAELTATLSTTHRAMALEGLAGATPLAIEHTRSPGG